MLQRFASRPLICRNKYGCAGIELLFGSANNFAIAQPCMVRTGGNEGGCVGVERRRSVHLTNHRKLHINSNSNQNNNSNKSKLSGSYKPTLSVNLGKKSFFATTTSSASSSSSSSAGSNDTSSAAIRDKLLQSSYLHVPTMGFTERALTSGANDIGLSPLSVGMLENGVADLVYYFLRNKRTAVMSDMEDAFKKQQNGVETGDGGDCDKVGVDCSSNSDINNNNNNSNNTSSSSSSNFSKQTMDSNRASFNSEDDEVNRQKTILSKYINLHIDKLTPHLNEWPDAVAVLAKPGLAWSNLQVFMMVIEDMVSLLDIKTSRMDWYVERCLLTYLYTTTELYLMSDRSHNSVDTREFLERNICGYIQIRSAFRSGVWSAPNMALMQKMMSGFDFRSACSNISSNPIFSLVQSFVSGSSHFGSSNGNMNNNHNNYNNYNNHNNNNGDNNNNYNNNNRSSSSSYSNNNNSSSSSSSSIDKNQQPDDNHNSNGNTANINNSSSSSSSSNNSTSK